MLRQQIQTTIKRLYCTTSTTTNKNVESKPLIDNLYKVILKDNYKTVEIKENEKKMRGLFYRPLETPNKTLPTINEQTNKPNIIFKEEPFISYPSIIKINQNICNHCLKPLEQKQQTNTIIECEECKIDKYCSNECKEKASVEYHSVLCKSTGSGFNYLEKHASIEKRRFPLLAGKIMARMLMGYYLEKSAKNTWLPLQLLSYAKKPPPLEWKDDYLIFSRSLLKHLESNKQMLNRFDYDNWFVRVMQILYLNTIGIDIEDTTTTTTTTTKMSSPESGIGLYLLTSFINHNCDPNSFIHFPNDHTMNLSPLKPINPGDEITISYTDASKNIVERRSHLFENYGFNCECQKCLNELNKKAK